MANLKPATSLLVLSLSKVTLRRTTRVPVIATTVGTPRTTIAESQIGQVVKNVTGATLCLIAYDMIPGEEPTTPLRAD